MPALEGARNNRPNSEAFSTYLQPEIDADIPIYSYRKLLTVRRRENIFRIARAATVTILAFCTVLLGFLFHARPQYAAIWFQVAIVLGAISLLATPLVWSCLAFQRWRRQRLTQNLYSAGLRLDDSGNLVTDEAHYRVICEKC